MLDFLTEFLNVAFPWVILIIMLLGWGDWLSQFFPGTSSYGEQLSHMVWSPILIPQEFGTLLSSPF